MRIVYILIQDRVFYHSTGGGSLYGHVRCHTHRTIAAPVCTFHISSCRIGDNDQDDDDAPGQTTAPKRIGTVLDQSLPTDESVDSAHPIDEFHVAFTHPYATANSKKRLELQQLRVPGLTAATRVKIITYTGRDCGVDSPSPKCGGPTLYGLLIASSERSLAALHTVGALCPIVRHTAVFQHLLSRCTLMGRPSVSTVSTLACDTIAGLLVTLLLLRIGHPYFHLTHCTEAVVVSVRHLLGALKGFPIGLKLNIELNNFMLGIFTYHIDLWVTFLVLIAPMLHCLFVPFVALGALGLSLQLAILADLLVFISLHAHCFYIYVAVLYHNELAAIEALWRVLRGTRHNTLKQRVEAHDYTSPQLYLATMFFTSLLFLLPTVLLYYVVFAFLRFCVYCTMYLLIAIQRRVLTFPVYAIVMRMLDAVRHRHGTELQIIGDVPSALPNRVSLTSIVEGRPGGREANETADDSLAVAQLPTVFQFFMSLVRGHIMGFILPLSKGHH